MTKIFSDLEITMVKTGIKPHVFERILNEGTQFYTGDFHSHHFTKHDNYTIGIHDFILQADYEVIETINHELEHYYLTKILRAIEILYSEKWQSYLQAPEHILSSR